MIFFQITKFNEKVCEVGTLTNSVSSLQRVSTILHLQKRSRDQNMAVSLLESLPVFALLLQDVEILFRWTHTHITLPFSTLEEWKCTWISGYLFWLVQSFGYTKYRILSFVLWVILVTKAVSKLSVLIMIFTRCLCEEAPPIKFCFLRPCTQIFCS